MSANSYPPSIREICNDLGYSSPSSAFFALKEIRDRGYIEISEGKKRAISLVGDVGTIKVPLLVKVGEGPRITGSAPMSYVYYSTKDKSKDYFAVTLKDDAMSGAGMFAGDVIIAIQKFQPSDGDAVVLMAGGEVTVRRAVKKGEGFVYKAEDGKTGDLAAGDCYVLGKVCALQRVYK
jgi:repressor LexA